jgi:endonuclease YncB( thermonuclease family)
MLKRFFAFILLLFGASESPAEILQGRCSYVQDGDSLKFIPSGENEEVRVRLYGIDAPEKSQEYAGQSRKKLEKLIRGKRIRLEVMDKDKYGRFVAKVYVGETYVNLEMLRAGLAWHYEYYADKKNDHALVKAEEDARLARKGVWSADSQVVHPREHRRAHGTEHSRK